MLIVIPFCDKDAPQAANLLRWMRELDGKHVLHSCALVAPRGIQPKVFDEVKAEALLSFSTVTALRTRRREERPWPIAPNMMFRCFLKWAEENHPGYFWWNEPDCIPLKTRWADLIEECYVKARKPFMGFVVDKPRPHLTGCAVYPSNAVQYNRALEVGPENIAWDCIDPDRTLKHTHHTNLFHHQWNGFNGNGVPTFPTANELKLISEKAVVFHRNKDQTLIDRLRENRNGFEDGMALGRRHRLLTARTKHVNTVYSYYEDLNRPEEARVIELWKQSWETNGWKVLLMGDSNTWHYPGKVAFLRAVSKLPSINPPGYDLACYKRWMAMVAFGGGLMVDYDVMNYGFTPEMATQYETDVALVFLEEKVPSAVIGTRSKFQFACNYMKVYRPLGGDVYGNQPHVSDMTILQRVWGTPWIRHQPVVKQFGQADWDKALLVHYSNGSTNGDKIAAIKSRGSGYPAGTVFDSK